MSSDHLIEQLQRLSDAEQAYVARWVAITNPDTAKAGLEALAEYRSTDPDSAALLLGPQTCQICGHVKDGRVRHPPECGKCPEGYCEARS